MIEQMVLISKPVSCPSLKRSLFSSEKSVRFACLLCAFYICKYLHGRISARKLRMNLHKRMECIERKEIQTEQAIVCVLFQHCMDQA